MFQLCLPKAKKAMSNKGFLGRAATAIAMVDQFTSLAAGADPLTLQHAVGHLEVHLVAVILDKKSRAHVKMEDACREVLVELGLGITIPSEWVAKGSTTATPSTAAKKAEVFRTYDDSGRMTNTVEVIKGLGFVVGQKVERHDQVGIIRSISEGEVELQMEEPTKTNVWVNSSSFVQNEWKIAHVPKQQEEVHWLPDSPLRCAEFRLMAMKAAVCRAMAEQMEKHKNFETLQLWAHPKAVTVTSTFGQKKLVIPCVTSRVQFIEATKVTDDHLVIGIFDHMSVVLTGMNKVGKIPGEGFQCPFWFIPRTSESDDANMEASRFEVVNL